jgi:CheY-like chemotaxis protein
MDLNLPDVDGWEATKRLKASPQTASIPIIALTAHAVVGDEQRALQAGCNDYHSKPVEFTRLVDQIEALLKGTDLAKDT